MVNRIVPPRTGKAVLPDSPPGSADDGFGAVALHQVKQPAANAPRNLQSRFMAHIGLLFPAPHPRLEGTQLEPPQEATARLLPLFAAAPLQVAAHKQAERHASVRAGAILDALPNLQPSEAHRYRRLLDNVMRSSDPARQAALLTIMEANVMKAARRRAASVPAATLTTAFGMTTLGRGFEDVVTGLTLQRKAQWMQLQHEIGQLPERQARRYRQLLRGVLVSGHPQKRDGLLQRLRISVAARTRRR